MFLTDEISADMVEQLIEACCLLVRSALVKVASSALSFLKVLLSTFNKEDIRQYLKIIVSVGRGGGWNM